MHIRQETPADYPVVYTLIKDAFASAEHCDGNEQDLAAALRQSTSFVPELSLVAEADGRIVGHILFTKIRIGTSTQLALVPLSVLPAFQGQGVGSALVRRGHQIARDLGYSYSVVLGSETYYPRLWDSARLEALVAAGRLSREDADNIINGAQSADK